MLLKQLHRTYAILAVVLLAILPVAALTVPEALGRLFPQCGGTIAKVDDVRASRFRPDDPYEETRIPLDVERNGVLIHLDTLLAPDGRVGWARLVRIGRDARGEPCECGSVQLRDQGVSAGGGELRRRLSGTIEYVDVKWGAGAGSFRLVDRAGRHFQVHRLLLRENLPALIALLSLAALVLASITARRAARYATTLYAWTQAILDDNGRVVSSSGESLGIPENADLVQQRGAVLLAPNTPGSGGAYRDVPVLGRRDVVMGSHARWTAVTMGRFRNARTLAIVSALCACAGLAASLVCR